MGEISKISDVTAAYVAEYMRISELTDEDTQTINNLILIAKTFIRNYTGQTDLDQFQDFVIVLLVLVQDMWDNRTLYVDTNNLNYVIETILGLHSVNLL